MKNIDLEYLCSVIAGLSGIPVRIFDGTLLFIIPLSAGFRETRW